MMTFFTNISWVITLVVDVFLWALTVCSFFWMLIITYSNCVNDTMEGKSSPPRIADVMWARNGAAKVGVASFILATIIAFALFKTYPF